MSNYTKGPWTAQKGETYNVIDANGGRVLMATNLKGRHGLGGRRNPDEVGANVDLAAAAPELYEALKEMWAWSQKGTAAENGAKCSTLFEVERMVESALAKAEGKEATHA